MCHSTRRDEDRRRQSTSSEGVRSRRSTGIQATGQNEACSTVRWTHGLSPKSIRKEKLYVSGRSLDFKYRIPVIYIPQASVGFRCQGTPPPASRLSAGGWPAAAGTAVASMANKHGLDLFILHNCMCSELFEARHDCLMDLDLPSLSHCCCAS